MRVIEYWPPFLAALLEFQALAGAQQPELDTAQAAVRAAPDDFFLSTASEQAVERWERMLGLPVLRSAPLSERRFRILARTAEQRPFTVRRLRELLATLCGPDNAAVTVDGYTLTVRVALTARRSFDDVAALLDRVVPLNMQVDLSLLYNQYGALAPYTHAQLAAWTHERLRNEVLSDGE